MSWPQPTISGYNATPPADDGSQTASNVVAWATILGKIGNPLRTLLETTIGSLPPYLVPTGAIQAFAGSATPPGWLLCFGQAVSRSTYADLFAVIGTTYGSGDGTTTFNVPDLRGRVVAGKDDMGGAAAGRITSGVSGINGAALGAAGGDERLQQHAHGGPSHTHDLGNHTHVGGMHSHGITDPGHSHGYGTANAAPGSNPTNATASGSGVTNNFPPTSNASTGISIHSGGAVATTGPTPNLTGASGSGSTSTFGAGASENVQPTVIVNWIVKT